MVTDLEFALRIGAAALAGCLIGLERELRGHDPGIRTHALVAVGQVLRRARVQFLACPCREITLEQVVVFQVPGVNDHDLPPRNPRNVRTARNRCTRTVDSLMPVIALTSRGEQSP